METDRYTAFVRGQIGEGQHRLAHIVRTLLYRANPSLFDLLDFYKDEIFLEPMLFAYFNSKKTPVNLEQILFGYIEDDLRPPGIKVFADANGIVHLPNIGYCVSNQADKELALVWD